MGIALGVLEAAERVFFALVLPDSLLRVLVIALVASLPIVLLLAWLFDLTSKGVERTPGAPAGDPSKAVDSAGSARFIRQLVVASAAVVLIMTGVGWRYMPNDRVDLVDNRVVVAPFENITGDPDLDPEGRIVALFVTRNLGRIEGLDVVPSEAFLLPPTGPPVSDSAGPMLSPAQTLAERTKAGLVIHGSYYLAGGDLMYQAEVYDATRREILFSAEPIRADPPILARLETMRPELTRYERANLDLLQAKVVGDLQSSYRASARVAELVGTSSSVLLAGQSALAVNRPKAAIRHYLEYDRARVPGLSIWFSLGSAFHLVGRHGPEARLLREGVERYPGFNLMWAAELRALAARGKGALVLEELHGVDRSGMSAGLVLGVADELEVHGDPESAELLRARLFEREDALDLEERQEGDAAHEWGDVLYSLDRYSDSGAWFRGLIDKDPDDLRARVGAALAAARSGDRDYAEETIDWFGAHDAPYQYGRRILDQAAIAAALGDAERSVRFLEQAFEQGSQVFVYLHRDPAFRTVRDHPAFQDFLKPRG